MFINNYHNPQILYLDKKKKHIILNFHVHYTGYQLVFYNSIVGDERLNILFLFYNLIVRGMKFKS